MSVNSSLLKSTHLDYETDISHCFHCGEMIKKGDKYNCKIAGDNKPMCCMGCVGVAEMIIESELEDYYLKRTTKAKKPEVIQIDSVNKIESSPWKGIQELISDKLTGDILENRFIN